MTGGGISASGEFVELDCMDVSATSGVGNTIRSGITVMGGKLISFSSSETGGLSLTFVLNKGGGGMMMSSGRIGLALATGLETSSSVFGDRSISKELLVFTHASLVAMAVGPSFSISCISCRRGWVIGIVSIDSRSYSSCGS